MTALQALSSRLSLQFRRFAADRSGATSIEYAIIAAGIAVVLVVAVNGIGSSVKGAFTAASNGLN